MTAIERAGLRTERLTAELASTPDNELLPDNIILLVVLLLLAFLLLLGIAVRNSRKKSRQIEVLQNEIMHIEEDALKISLQNDWLATEMHHRVKNNLQILSSLINSQLAYISDKMGRETLSNIKYRLYALTLVHQRLFQNATASSIEISCCIKDLVEYLSDEYKSNDRISFELDLIPLTADVSFAIPFELIINELITNTLKFAFPGNRKGKVKISLSQKDSKTFQLRYADDGIGLPVNVDLDSGRSLGRSLIMGLARQIKAKVMVDNTRGLEIKMDFSAP
jgi:two-component sensor histidine kinase